MLKFGRGFRFYSRRASVKNALRIFIYFLVAFILKSPVFSATWNGGGSDNLASSATNWAGNVLPAHGAGLIFDSSAINCTWNLNETYTSLVIGSGYTGTLTLDSTLTLIPGLFQPNGMQIPSQMGCAGGMPTGLAPVMACQCLASAVGCNIGSPCLTPDSCDNGMNGVCETTLWHTYNDNPCIPSNLSGLDPWKKAAVEPQTIFPAGGKYTFKVVSRTSMFKDTFGWYNFTGTQPTVGDLHVVLNCNTVPGNQVEIDLSSDPAYLGGRIGFFMITPESHTVPGTCAGSNCCASPSRLMAGEGYVYYSERSYNPDLAISDSFIHLLLYDPHLQIATAYYLAWEDIYGGSDNDFTDTVIYVFASFN